MLGFNAEQQEDMKMQQFVNYAQIIHLDNVVVTETIRLKKSVKIKTPDAIIASSALAYGHILITNNVADFKRVEYLKVFNPYDIG